MNLRRILVTIVIAMSSAISVGENEFKLDKISLSMGQPFFSGQVIPCPQQVDYGQNDILLVDGSAKINAYDLILEYFGPSRELLSDLWNKRIESYRSNFSGVFKSSDTSQNLPILVTLLSDPSAKYFLDKFELHKKIEQIKPQGYILEIRPEGVLCAGMDNQGIVNGLASLLQLIHVKDEKLVVREASIVDWPVFTQRFFTGYNIVSDTTLELMTLYKMNGFATSYTIISWEGLTDAKRQHLKRLKKFLDYGTMNFMVHIHIGGRRQKRLDCGDETQINVLKKTISELVNNYGVNYVMLCADDTSSQLALPEEVKKFKNMGQAHAQVADEIYNYLQTLKKGTKLAFCPKFYQGRLYRWWKPNGKYYKLAMEYMAGLRKANKNIRIVWTGPLTCSIKVNDLDVRHYRGLIGDHPLLYWDNTILFHEPLSNFYATYPKGFVYKCADKLAYLCVRIERDPVAKFYVSTACDYYWNPDNFDQMRSRKNAVIQFLSPGAVNAAEAFYRFRGDGYWDHFKKMADLKKFRVLLQNLEKVCYDKGIIQQCWREYNRAVKAQKKMPLLHKDK